MVRDAEVWLLSLGDVPSVGVVVVGPDVGVPGGGVRLCHWLFICVLIINGMVLPFTVIT